MNPEIGSHTRPLRPAAPDNKRAEAHHCRACGPGSPAPLPGLWDPACG